MVAEVIIILMIVVVAGVLINAVEDYRTNKEKMSFREAMDLAELPIVTFYQGTEKFNFLLDTGSNHSHISLEVSNRIKGVPMVGSQSVSGVGGEVVIDKAIKSVLEYKSRRYETILLIGEHLDTTFKTIKETTGVTVHGIIGNSFLNENKYVLDFDELVAYSKKKR